LRTFPWTRANKGVDIPWGEERTSRTLDTKAEIANTVKPPPGSVGFCIPGD